MPFTTLIDCDELAARLSAPDWVIVDCRHDLARPAAGEEAWRAGHIPGARFAHLDRDLAAPPDGRNGRHPLPASGVLEETLRRLGVRQNSQVIAYDDAGGMYAGRLWWMLRWLGHEAVAVLDGGWKAWLAGQHPVSSAAPPVPRGDFLARPQPWPVTAEHVLAHLGDARTCIVDARGEDRYRGENETMDPVAGHIPGARNRAFRHNLGPDGCFKRPADLRREWDAFLQGRDPATVIHQCGSGVSACHNLLAMEIAGLTGSRLYPGSWSEWCADPQRPVATGPEPGSVPRS
jgi:thiosulfate/3-mercaptopyruvate sulfurtransferase